MQRKIITKLPDFPPSCSYEPLRITLNNIIDKIPKLQKDKMKDHYLITFKQMSWSMGKCSPNWPNQIQDIVVKLKKYVDQFESVLLKKIKSKKGSFILCGSNNQENPSLSLYNLFFSIVGYQQMFRIVGIYQNKKFKEEAVHNVMNILDENNALIDNTNSAKIINSSKQRNLNKQCEYCQLFKSISVCPNGFIAQKLLGQLPNSEWLAGILYEQGKIIQKNLQKAIQNYLNGKQNKQAQAIYRLGLLNQKGLYGNPYQFIQLWEQSSNLGHLQSMTDLGFIYQNGLQENGKPIIAVNNERAFNLYSKAADKNFPRALNNIASFYYNNIRYKNNEKCIKYLEQASKYQYVKSLYNLGLIYLEGQGQQSFNKAKQLIKKSAQKGDVQGKQQYIQIILNQIHNANVQELQTINIYCRQIIAQQQDNASCYYYMGLMYQGGYGVPQQPQTAILYYNKAIRYECPQAHMKLGDCYRNGFGVEQSSKDAIQHFQKAMTKLPQALIWIGQIYQKGYSDLKQDYQQAFNFYYTACNYELHEAYQHMGKMYFYGRHVHKNQEKAKQYFCKANLLNNKNSMIMNGSLIQSSYYRTNK